MRKQPAILEGAYQVIEKRSLRATAESDPAKWSIWKEIWACSTFEELARRCPDPVHTTSASRRITWRTEARWALKCGWIVQVNKPKYDGKHT